MQFESFHTVGLSLRRLGLAALFVAPAMGLLTGAAFADTNPTVLVPAKSSPATVLAKTSVLSVLGADDLGESKLIYTWSTMGTPPAVPTYSANAKNSAKTVTVTYKAAGSYEFKCVIKDGIGQTATSSVPVTVLQTPALSLSPTSIRLNPNASQTFTAALKDQFSKLMTLSGPVSYSVTGGGTISTNGVFKAGSVPGGPYTLTAVSGSLTATASIVVNAGPTIATPAAVSVNPVTGTNCMATVLGADDASASLLKYTWSATGPATVTFSPNGSTAANSTKVIFKKTGTYVLKATVKDAQGLTTQSSVSVNVVSTPVRVVVSPATVALDPLATAQFTVSTFDQFNAPMTNPLPAITWSAQGVSINASGLATADGDAGVSYTVLATAGSVFGSAILQINNVPSFPSPIITPAGGTFAQPLAVTITPSALTPLTDTPGWRTGVKYPSEAIEEIAALSRDGQSVAAMRARTFCPTEWKYPGASLSPDAGNIPFYIWSLDDLTGYYRPALLAGATENVAWDGNNYDFYNGELGNRVFILVHQGYGGKDLGGEISIWSCAEGVNQDYPPDQRLAVFPRIPMDTFAAQATQLEFAGEKVRVRVGATPLTSAATDADGWVTYIATNVLSSRVAVPLDATRFWFTLAGGDVPGRGELLLSDKPETITRFTWDGSPVTETSTPVDGPLTLTFDALIRSRVYGAALYRSTETVAAFTSAIPQLPAESYVSPAYITITHATLDGTPAQVSLDGPSGNMPGLSIGDFLYLMRYPLLPDEPTPLILHRNNVADLSGNVTWRALEIGNAPDMQIRQGESLLLTAGMIGETGTLQIVVLDSSNQVFGTCTGLPGETFPVLFDRGGLFNAVATLNGVSIGSLFVSVAHVDLQGPIACQIGYRREKEVLIYGPTNDIFFTSSDSKTMTVTNKVQTQRGMRLYLKALKAGKPMLQARLGSPTGPIIAQQVVDVFTLDITGKASGVIDMATGETFDRLVMTPYIPGLDFNFSMFAHHATFEDGTIQCAIHSSDFTIFTNETGVVCGYYDLRIYVPGGEASLCYCLTAQQYSVPIGWISVNSTKCMFAIPGSIIIVAGKSGNITVLVDNPDNKYLRHGTAGAHQIEIAPTVGNCPLKLSTLPGNHDCREGLTRFPLQITADADATLGSYDILISKHHFVSRVLVTKLLVEIQVRNTADQKDDYIPKSAARTFSCQARVVWPRDDQQYNVTLKSKDGDCGKVAFPTAPTTTVLLPGNGTWVPFNIRGETESKIENDASIIAEWNGVECGAEDLTVANYRIEEVIIQPFQFIPKSEQRNGRNLNFISTHFNVKYKVTDTSFAPPDNGVDGASVVIKETFPTATLVWNAKAYKNTRPVNSTPVNLTTDGSGLTGLDSHNFGLGWVPMTSSAGQYPVDNAMTAGFSGDFDHSASFIYQVEAYAEKLGSKTPVIYITYQWTEAQTANATRIDVIRDGETIAHSP